MINKRKDFPILSREVYGKPLVYLDNAATTQKPLCVLDAMRDEYLNVNANVHRGVHYLSQQATDLHEAAREKVRQFIHARKTEEIVFTRGTTEAINLVASSFCESQMQEGDEVLVTEMEHHSNIVPWQLQAMKRGIIVKHLPITDDGRLVNCDDIATYMTERTKFVSVTHVSNVLGTVNPVKEIIQIAHEHGIPVLVDGAQSAPHMMIDVQDLDCDFFAFSGHKMYGPTGIGVLYGKEEWLEKLPPYQGGGEMIDKVTWEKTTFERLPFKFEAGTPDFVATHGLATAIDYIQSIGFDAIQQHEQELTRYCMQQLLTIPDIHIYGPQLKVQSTKFKVQSSKDAVVSFNLGSIHHLDVGTLLDRLGIAVRTGHHCAQPLMDRLGISGTVRASFALYNTKEEVDALVAGIERIRKMF
ncbi:MAG: cysteine desulfurase [Prevotella sp.]|nr:cysteine desulfurase [Prevotella sp.]